MRKSLLIPLLLLCFSCERYENQIVGAWRFYDEIEKSFMFYSDGLAFTKTLVFHSDGTGFMEGLIYWEDSWEQISYGEFDYLIDPDSIAIDYIDAPEYSFAVGYSLNKDRLELHWADGNSKEVYLRQ